MPAASPRRRCSSHRNCCLRADRICGARYPPAVSSVDLAAMQKRRAGIVAYMTGGVASLFKAAGVTAIYGSAACCAGRRVEVTAHDGTRARLSARTWCSPAARCPTELKALPFDHRCILDSWDALELPSVPGKLCVIGAGVIGLELGSVWRRLGARSSCWRRWRIFWRSPISSWPSRRRGISRNRAWISGWARRSPAPRVAEGGVSVQLPGRRRRAEPRCRQGYRRGRTQAVQRAICSLPTPA